eukprot:gene8630-10987_t
MGMTVDIFGPTSGLCVQARTTDNWGVAHIHKSDGYYLINRMSKSDV